MARFSGPRYVITLASDTPVSSFTFGCIRHITCPIQVIVTYISATILFILAVYFLNNTIKARIAICCLLVLCSFKGYAQSLSAMEIAGEPASRVAENILDSGPEQTTIADRILPFGHNLFNGGFTSEREDGLNPDYLIVPGDNISISIWGALNHSSILTVDPQGNIFVPDVGPVAVGGVPNYNLNKTVQAAVRTVFTDNVKVYTSLNGSRNVAVFVTGHVTQPGRFAGIPSNSPLFFLDKAQGIDPVSGSYRKVRVIRGNQTVAEIDLYRFLSEGYLPTLQFKDGDVIHVEKRGAVVTVTGDVGVEAKFELLGETLSGRDIMDLVLPSAGVSFVGISGLRNNQPISEYLQITDFLETQLRGGDELNFSVDNHDNVIVVELEGSFMGPSRYVVPNNTRLIQLLDHIEVDLELTDVSSISIKRKSIAERQKSSLNNSLQRLEARYLTANSQTDAEANIRAQEAQMISEFVARARTVEPDGRLVVSENGRYADITLQNGDVVNIPSKNESILLSGEVLIAQAMLYRSGHSALDYIKRSGGFSQQADKDRIILVHANGEVTADATAKVRPGDEIIVLPKVPVKNLQIASVIVDILYKIAVAASVAVQL